MSQYDYRTGPGEDEPIQVLIALTDGDGIPDSVSDGNGGIETPEQVSPEVCRIIRQLRPTLTNTEVSELLDYARMTVSQHTRGVRNCRHTDGESGPPVTERTDEARSKPMHEATDRETMIVTGAGSSTFHLNADGEPACGYGHRGEKPKNGGGERDPVGVYVWDYSPCRNCFWRHYRDGTASRRIAEIEYELVKRGQRDLIRDWGWENDV